MTSKANNENFNIVNVSKKSNKENIQKINPIEGQIKVKLNSKISQVKKTKNGKLLIKFFP